ncbi:DUF6660 family protein [Mariniflexile sp.]|uniref:DUF6660 family protein n=1 Tax=Mariniflexile sp. TaxID=1979402 RepID=UPI00404720D2
MKIIAVLLAVLTITLSALPCEDDAAAGLDNPTTVTDNSHNENHNDFDACTPFCSCVCCANVVVKPLLQTSLSYSEITSKEATTYNISSFPNGNLPRIFQPPKV